MNLLKKIMPSRKEQRVVEITKEQVDREMTSWIHDMQKKVPRVSKAVFFNSDNEDDLLINLKPIYNRLGGKPSKDFYMSRITFDIFEEDEKDLALLLDSMQVIVEDYFIKRGTLPIKPESEENEIEYPYLIGTGLLKDTPDTPLYIEEFEYGVFFVTLKPQKQKVLKINKT